jgi:hypothetical protein
MLKKMLKGAVAGLFLSLAFSQGAQAADVAGVNFKETVKVAGKELQLNGAGVRHKFVIKVYAAGLYLPAPKTTTDEVMKTEGPRRMQLVMLRDISADEFGSSFMSGINNNLNKDEKTRIVTQISKMGEVFAMMPSLKKGDVLDLDWIPGTGLVCGYNGKPIGDVMPDVQFHNAVLKIWLGDKPADAKLKPKLLAGK